MSNASDSLSVSVGRTIANQIGQRAFFMIGAKDLVTNEEEGSLTFRVGRNVKSVSHVIVKLDKGTDSYTVEFRRIRQGRLNKKTWTRSPDTNKLLESYDLVYVDDLHKIIEKGTGLLTRLF